MNTLTKTMFAVLAGCMLLFAGCQKEEQAIPVNTNTTNLPIFGNWKSVSYERVWNNDPIANPNPPTSLGLDTGSVEIELRPDSTFQLWSDDNTINSDTGQYRLINIRLMLQPTSFYSYYRSPITIYSDSSMSFSIYHYAEYTLNDTGANAVLGDSLYSYSKYIFKRQ